MEIQEKFEKCLRLALENDVTDIHFNVKEEQLLSVQMRKEGKLINVPSEFADLHLLHYLMFSSGMDLANIMRPQTGSFQVTLDNQAVSLRFAIVRSFSLVSGVLRILNCHPLLTVADLSFDNNVIDWMERIQHHRSGLYIFSGPTGSGKTTTLYTILNGMQNKKIYTLEDPVEVVNDKYVQLQINPAQHLSYGEGIKQLMRHDPDVIMIGEIRDQEAAMAAVSAALTGHLVLSSLHSFSCLAGIDRLLDLGVKPYQLLDVLNGIANQRLYDTPDGRKTGVYEICPRKEVQYFFAHRQYSSEHESLTEAVEKACRSGWIKAEEAEEDLT